MQARPLKDKFIAYVDILGYTNMKESAEAGIGMSLPELASLRDLLCTSSDRNQFTIDGPTLCPRSQYISRDLDFQISHEEDNDCSLFSCEVSPAGAVNLLGHCSRLALRLLKRGVLCRGYVTRDLIHHTATTYEGPGLETVLTMEKKVAAFSRDADDRGTPFIEIDSSICEYVSHCEDCCVTEIFSKLAKGDGRTFALLPFERLGNLFNLEALDQYLDIEKARQSIKNTRPLIITLKERVKTLVDVSNKKALRKSEHYLMALNDLLEKCDQADMMLDELNTPFPSGNLTDLLPFKQKSL